MPAMPRRYRVLRWIIGGLLRRLTRLDIVGVEHVPSNGSLIVALNHIHSLDVVVVFAAVPRYMLVFAAEHWRGTPAGWLLQMATEAIYVQRGEVDRRSLSRALTALRQGEALGLAPEGTRSRTGALIEGKDGAAYLASRSGAAILPVVCWGQEHALSSLLRLHRPDVHVHIGEPIRLPPAASHARAAEITPYTDELMLTMARMLPPEYRGVYAGRS